MRFVDLHCDTIAMKVALSGGKTELYKNDCHIDIEKLQKGGCLAQFFAIFVPINGAAENHGVKLGSYDFFQMAYKVYLEQMEKNKDYILPAMNYEDIMRNKEMGKMSSVLTIEEGHPVEGKMERIKEFYDKGVRLLTLTWNYEDCLSNTLTVVKNTRNVDISDLNKKLADYGVTIAAGYGKLKETTFRISHMGDYTMDDMKLVTSSIDKILGL